jgi:hypothetical protein
LLLAGCYQDIPKPITVVVPEQIIPGITPDMVHPDYDHSKDVVDIAIGVNQLGLNPKIERPAFLPDGTIAPMPVPPAGMEWGVYPSKVTISNMFPGAEADYFVGVYNGRAELGNFTVTARDPDKLDSGFLPLPLTWITIAPRTVKVKGKEVVNVSVVIKIPYEAKGKLYQTFIGVRDNNAGGFVKIESASNWRIRLTN